MFYSSVSQACDEMNSRAQGRRSTVSKFAYKKKQKQKNSKTINICKDTVPRKQSNLTRDEVNTVHEIQ